MYVGNIWSLLKSYPYLTGLSSWLSSSYTLQLMASSFHHPCSKCPGKGGLWCALLSVLEANRYSLRCTVSIATKSRDIHHKKVLEMCREIWNKLNFPAIVAIWCRGRSACNAKNIIRSVFKSRSNRDAHFGRAVGTAGLLVFLLLWGSVIILACCMISDV